MWSHCSAYQNVYNDCACANPTFFRQLSKASQHVSFWFETWSIDRENKSWMKSLKLSLT